MFKLITDCNWYFTGSQFATPKKFGKKECFLYHANYIKAGYMYLVHLFTTWIASLSNHLFLYINRIFIFKKINIFRFCFAL